MKDQVVAAAPPAKQSVPLPLLALCHQAEHINIDGYRLEEKVKV